MASPLQGIVWGNRSWITKSIADGRRVRVEAIRLGEVSGQFEPGVLAELHQHSEIVGEGKLQITTCDGHLQGLLHGLLGVKANRRIGDLLGITQGFGRGEIPARKNKEVAG